MTAYNRKFALLKQLLFIIKHEKEALVKQLYIWFTTGCFAQSPLRWMKEQLHSFFK